MTDSILLIQDLAVILVSASIAGLVCRRLKISSVVGYLVCGIIIGTPQITFIYVTDAARIQTLSQLGLVCLMFFIGLQFRIRKLKELGAGVIIATALSAIITLTLTRIVTTALGYSEAESLFISGMLVVSSSAIISRVLEENKLNHKRFGQLALGMTLLEDMVAIVMLAWLGSYSAAESMADSGSALGPLLKTLGLLAAFVTLVIVPGLVLIPRWLRRLGGQGETEPESLLVGGLLFAMAIVTVLSGFSLALGAFLCGVIVAESTNARSISLNFTALKDIFVTVFFTAIGMSIDVMRLPEALGLIVLGVGLAFTVRVLAATLSLMLVGESEDNALRAGLSITPIGEFSFVIASLGISSGLLSPDFQIAAVGIAFVTSLFSPFLIKQSDRIAKFASPARIGPVAKPLKFYREMLNLGGEKRRANPVSRIFAPRIWQLVREFVFITAVVVFSRPGYVAVSDWVASTYPGFEGLSQFYWLAVMLLCLLPFVALIRNGHSLLLLLSEHLFGLGVDTKAFRATFLGVARLLGSVVLAFWLFNILPFAWIDRYVLLGICAVATVAVISGWRLLIRWYSHVDVAIAESLESVPADHDSARQLKESSAQWDLSLVEFRLPDDSVYSGKTVAESGLRSRTDVSIIGIERQGFQLSAVGPTTHLFSGDLLYLLGEGDSLQKANELLALVAPDSEERTNLAGSILDQVVVPENAVCAGRTLGQLQWPKHYGVQVAAIVREGERRLSPDLDHCIQPRETLLLAGTQAAINEVRRAMNPAQ